MQAFVSNSSAAPHLSESLTTRQPANFAPAADLSTQLPTSTQAANLSTQPPLSTPAVDLSTQQPLSTPAVDLSTQQPLSTPAVDLATQQPLRAPATPKPTNRGEIIFQQEKKIRNEFIRKPNARSNQSNLSMISSGKNSQSNNCLQAPEQLTSAFRSKLIASTIAAALMLLAVNLSIPFLTQPLATQTFNQSSSKQINTEAHFGNSMASTGNVATLPGGAAKTESSSGTVEDETRKMNDLIAIARAHAMATKPGESQAQKTKSDETNATETNATEANLTKTSTVNLSTMTTVDLVKTGYEKLRSGAAQESIPVLSEAVRRDSNDPTSRRYLGYALLETGRPAEALNQYEALRSLNGLQETDRLAIQHAEYLLQTGNKPTESRKSF